MIRPFIATMTKSELHAVMTGGFATIAGSVLGAYIGFGVSTFLVIVADVVVVVVVVVIVVVVVVVVLVVVIVVVLVVIVVVVVLAIPSWSLWGSAGIIIAVVRCECIPGEKRTACVISLLCHRVT